MMAMAKSSIEPPRQQYLAGQATTTTGRINQDWVPHCPDFLRRLVALINSMRLSLMKGAHADLSSTAWQEIGVMPRFWA
jgi:hypothetical protein